MTRKVIAVDCDDVLVASTEMLVTEYNKKYGTDISLLTAHDHGVDQWQVRDIQTVIDRLTDIQIAHNVEILEGAVDQLRRLADIHELHIITARPIETELVTLRLVENSFKNIFTSIEHVGHEGSKGEVCARLGADVLVDDNLKHIEEALKYGVSSGIWFGDYPWQKQEIPPFIVRCKNWAEVGAYFEREQF